MLVMDGCSKNLNNLFYKPPMDASGWMKKILSLSDEEHPNKHMLVLRHAENSTSVFLYDKGC